MFDILFVWSPALMFLQDFMAPVCRPSWRVIMTRTARRCFVICTRTGSAVSQYDMAKLAKFKHSRCKLQTELRRRELQSCRRVQHRNLLPLPCPCDSGLLWHRTYDLTMSSRTWICGSTKRHERPPGRGIHRTYIYA